MKRRPIPQRKPDCRFYDDCLKEHSMTDSLFACTGCGEYQRKELSPITAISENQNYLHLLLAIFYPDAYEHSHRRGLSDA